MKTNKESFRIITSFLTASFMIILSCLNLDLYSQDNRHKIIETELTRQRDSLIRLFVQRSRDLEAKTEGYNNVLTQKDSLEARNRTLQSGYNKKAEQIKKTETVNKELMNAMTIQNSKNDSLLQEINILREKVAEIDAEIAREKSSKTSMAESLRQHELKLKADSAALAGKAKPFSSRGSGFIDIFEIGGAFGLGNTSVDYSRSLISLNNVFGYEFDKHFILGVGTGVNFYNGGTMIPLYIDMRYSLNSNGITPFLSADGGVLLTFSNLGSSGIFISPAIGLGKELSKKLSMKISTGFLIQDAPSGMRNTFITIKGGISFAGNR